MKVIIRVDASVDIGTGHVMRCLTLAERLQKDGAVVTFICRELPGNLCGFIESRGFKVRCLQGVEKQPDVAGLYEKWLCVNAKRDAEETVGVLRNESGVDWLVIDHYSIDKGWESRMRPFVKKIMVIDDLTNRGHDCDLLLNQSIFEESADRYNGLVPQGCKKLIGPKFALLRPEFAKARAQMKARDGRIKRIFVFFGGSDITNETMKALRAIRSLGLSDLYVDVVAGVANAHVKEIKEFCGAMPNAVFYGQTTEMAALMGMADLAIGAAGTTSWERCALGLPALVVVIAENQAEIAATLDAMGVIANLGAPQDASEEAIVSKIREFLNNPGLVKAMSIKSSALTDCGGVDAVLNEILN